MKWKPRQQETRLFIKATLPRGMGVIETSQPAVNRQFRLRPRIHQPGPVLQVDQVRCRRFADDELSSL